MATNQITGSSGIAKIKNNRGDLEALTETDLPCADLAAKLLEVAEE